MNIVTALLLIAAFVRNVEAFPIAESKTSVRQDHHRLYSSLDDRIVDNDDSVDAHQTALNDAVEDTEVRQDHHQLYSSSDDRIVDNTDSVDAPPKARNDAVEDTKALSGLLGEMFQAKLEISRENKELESLASKKSDMPVLGSDGIYRIINQKQLE
jgi:hypothetical protein